MTPDERWAYYVAVPALVASLPVYVVSVAYYCACREGFATALTFMETCGVIGKRQDEEMAA